jgi:hypothetical protein
MVFFFFFFRFFFFFFSFCLFSLLHVKKDFFPDVATDRGVYIILVSMVRKR